MKLIVSNTEFEFNIGCRVAKMKYGNECHTFMEDALGDVWNEIQPLTFQEIASQINNIEQRRIAIGLLGIENVIAQVKPTLIDRSTIKKTTTWVNESGNLETKEYEDIYELFEVKGKDLYNGVKSAWGLHRNQHYVKFKCTSTDREYYIWIDEESVKRTNGFDMWKQDTKINAIQSIAWTIQTNIKQGGIEKIVRQGDCIMIKLKDGAEQSVVRHLTEEEYRTLLAEES